MKKFISLLTVLLVMSFTYAQGPLGKFTTFDIDGKVATEKIFSKADVTVLNIWGTFCGPCIKEMPELAEWSESMPKNAQLVGLICDINSSADKKGINSAKNILSKAGCNFTNIIASNDLQNFLQNIQFVPTTILVDKKGNIIGKPIIGADVKKYKTALEKYLNEIK